MNFGSIAILRLAWVVILDDRSSACRLMGSTQAETSGEDGQVSHYKIGGMVKHQPLGGTLNKEMYEMVFVMLSML